jgi:hypothetical protein
MSFPEHSTCANINLSKGLIMVDTRDPLRFLQTEVSRLNQENQELREELTILRSSVRGLSAIQDLIQRMGPQTNLIHVLDDLLGSALAVLGTRDGSLLLRDDETDELVFVVVRGEARDRLQGYKLPPGKGIAGWVADNREPAIVLDVRKDPRFFTKVDETMGFHRSNAPKPYLMRKTKIAGERRALSLAP